MSPKEEILPPSMVKYQPDHDRRRRTAAGMASDQLSGDGVEAVDLKVAGLLAYSADVVFSLRRGRGEIGPQDLPEGRSVLQGEGHKVSIAIEVVSDRVDDAH